MQFHFESSYQQHLVIYGFEMLPLNSSRRIPFASISKVKISFNTLGLSISIIVLFCHMILCSSSVPINTTNLDISCQPFLPPLIPSFLTTFALSAVLGQFYRIGQYIHIANTLKCVISIFSCASS